MNVNKLKGKIVEKGLSVTEVAEKIGIDRSSLYRKLNKEGATLTIKEANLIVKILEIPPNEAIEIFFKDTVAWYANYGGDLNVEHQVYIARKEHRLTQKEIAKRIGMCEKSYQLKENGKRPFTIGEARKLARIFNSSLDELFGEVK